MRNPQFFSIVLLAVAFVLFLFSLALVPPVELYCRLKPPALLLLLVQIALFLLYLIRKPPAGTRVLRVACVAFTILGGALNTLLLMMARGRC
jgi:hypothetical protein